MEIKYVMEKDRSWPQLILGAIVMISLVPVYIAGFVFGVAFSSFRKAMHDSKKFIDWI